jgi:uncharacterized protein (TIGR00645 family)
MLQIERGFQTVIFFSRRLLAPFLVGLVLSLFLLTYRFFADFFGLAIGLTGLTWHDLIVGVLNMIDIVLAANLVLIVIFSGYENFIKSASYPRVSASMPLPETKVPGSCRTSVSVRLRLTP